MFRVENEHCTNVERFRASRDVPLPYNFKQPETIAEEGGLLAPVGEEQETNEAQLEEDRRQGVKPSPSGLSHVPSRTSGNDIHRTHTEQSTSGSIRRRRKIEQSPLIRRMGSILHMAHAQDFERKKRPEAGEAVDKSSDSEGDDEDDSSDDVEQEVEEAERVVDEEMAKVDGANERGRDAGGKRGGEDGKKGNENESEEAGKESSAEEGNWEFRKVDGDGGGISSGMQSPKGHSPPK